MMHRSFLGLEGSQRRMLTATDFFCSVVSSISCNAISKLCQSPSRTLFYVHLMVSPLNEAKELISSISVIIRTLFEFGAAKQSSFSQNCLNVSPNISSKGMATTPPRSSGHVVTLRHIAWWRAFSSANFGEGDCKGSPRILE